MRPAPLFGVDPGCLGSLMGGIKIEQMGAQNHKPTIAEIEARFQKEFGFPMR